MIRIIALTEAGLKLASQLQIKLSDSEVWFKPDPFADQIQKAFKDKDTLVFICATGIVVRTLAPVIKSKHDDPPVVVIDELGRYVIPLLSGHEGGANEIAASIADLIHGQLVITTANPYLKPIYTVGMGCERDCPESVLVELFKQAIDKSGVGSGKLHSINSIDIKADEAGLLALSSTVKVPFKVWDKTALTSVEHLLSQKSEYVYKTVGVYGVAESAALYAAEQVTGTPAELVLTKIKNKQATCAIARSYPHQEIT